MIAETVLRQVLWSLESVAHYIWYNFVYNLVDLSAAEPTGSKFFVVWDHST